VNPATQIEEGQGGAPRRREVRLLDAPESVVGQVPPLLHALQTVTERSSEGQLSVEALVGVGLDHEVVAITGETTSNDALTRDARGLEARSSASGHRRAAP
jgi:hypothetical protein